MAETVFKEVLEVMTSDEWVSEYPDLAMVALSREEVERIVEMADTAMEKDYGEIRRFDYSPEYGYEAETGRFREAETDDEKMWARLECQEVCVSVCGDRADVRWRSVIKHTNVAVSTDRVDVTKLREALEAA